MKSFKINIIGRSYQDRKIHFTVKNSCAQLIQLSRSSNRRCSVKKVFLEISQNLQEKMCQRLFLRKLQLNFYRIIKMSFNFSIQTASFSKPPKNQPKHPQTTQKPVKPPTNQPNHPETTQKPANYEQKISFLCYQKLQQQCKTCAKFATILLHFINVQQQRSKPSRN